MGDRLIHQVNDYDREVFKGNLETITAIDPEEQGLTLRYDQLVMTYD